MNAVNLVKRRAKDPGSARVSRAGDRVLAITDFLGGALLARKIVAARRGATQRFAISR